MPLQEPAISPWEHWGIPKPPPVPALHEDRCEAVSSLLAESDVQKISNNTSGVIEDGAGDAHSASPEGISH